MKDVHELTVAEMYKLRFGYKKPAWRGFRSMIEEVEVSNGDLASVTTKTCFHLQKLDRLSL